ncbi:uncharacterized protein METZ01_LOCUS346854 [marine metagenome]|uniref:Uncharacterized protein n=1 Tax=marine metagenome TaxID=408172 RepID=A0A382R9I3_9ZZZZ
MYVGIPSSKIKKVKAPMAIEKATGILIQSKKKNTTIGRKIILKFFELT